MESLRPARLADCIGQKRVRENLRMDIDAALVGGRAVKHLLFHGPPGLGKTTLSRIVAAEMDSDCTEFAAPTLDDPSALVKTLVNMRECDVLFVDEIHRLPPRAQETLYPALEDGILPNSRYELDPFTFIGATTRLDLVAAPLRDRFGELYRMRFYEQDEMEQVVARTARLIELAIDGDGVAEIARRARGTPRIANRLTMNVRDYAVVQASGRGVTDSDVEDVMRARGIDSLGLTDDDRELLQALYNAGGKPIGIETLAAVISAEPSEVQRVNEPFLLRAGLIERTSKGRMITHEGRLHIALGD